MYRDWDDYEPEQEEYPRDPAIDAAARRVRDFFDAQPARVFYSTQIETALEREYFHWITGKALLELGNNRGIQRVQATAHGNNINFYAHLKHRYFRREMGGMVSLLNRIFDPEFTHAVGRHGELMFDAALGRAGFQASVRNAIEWQGQIWTETNHNLDRIITRDGRAYGVEIKNTQNYISHQELRIKLRLCEHLGVTPLFIMRFAPKSYIHEVNQRRGFVLLYEEQMYPWGHAELLREVRRVLGLKVSCPNDVKEGDIQRLLNWHNRQMPRA
jgi:hypothetical protein